MCSAVLLSAAAVWQDGPFIFRHLLEPRLLLPDRAIRQSGLFLIISAPGLVPVAIWAWYHRSSRRPRLLILAWVSCLRVGVWLQAHVPIKVKAHGRPAMSLVRYGAEQLCNALRWNLPELPGLIRLLSMPFQYFGEELKGP